MDVAGENEEGVRPMGLLPMVLLYRKLQEVRPFQHPALELFKFIYVNNTLLCLFVHGHMEGGKRCYSQDLRSSCIMHVES